MQCREFVWVLVNNLARLAQPGPVGPAARLAQLPPQLGTPNAREEFVIHEVEHQKAQVGFQNTQIGVDLFQVAIDLSHVS